MTLFYCKSCHKGKPRSAFSKNQMKRSAINRNCKNCIEIGENKKANLLQKLHNHCVGKDLFTEISMEWPTNPHDLAVMHELQIDINTKRCYRDVFMYQDTIIIASNKDNEADITRYHFGALHLLHQSLSKLVIHQQVTKFESVLYYRGGSISNKGIIFVLENDTVSNTNIADFLGGNNHFYDKMYKTKSETSFSSHSQPQSLELETTEENCKQAAMLVFNKFEQWKQCEYTFNHFQQELVNHELKQKMDAYITMQREKITIQMNHLIEDYYQQLKAKNNKFGKSSLIQPFVSWSKGMILSRDASDERLFSEHALAERSQITHWIGKNKSKYGLEILGLENRYLCFEFIHRITTDIDYFVMVLRCLGLPISISNLNVLTQILLQGFERHTRISSDIINELVSFMTESNIVPFQFRYSKSNSEYVSLYHSNIYGGNPELNKFHSDCLRFTIELIPQYLTSTTSSEMQHQIDKYFKKHLFPKDNIMVS